MIDSHVHIKTNVVQKSCFRKRLSGIGGNGAVILSLPPETFFDFVQKYSFTERLDNILEWCSGEKDFYPFFWLDPLAGNAQEQIDSCCEKGIAGFKIICDRFYPSNENVMKVFKRIAEKGKPVLLHSGILWDGKVSSKYNRPLEFECLLEVPKLKFALAHVSWPWCDELIALYGKCLNSLGLNPKTSAEMFIDTTPGTPAIYRENVLRKLYTVGYDIENNLLFGLDSYADEYNSTWAKEWIERDGKILRDLDLKSEQIEKYFSGNIKRFLGVDCLPVDRKLPVAGSN